MTPAQTYAAALLALALILFAWGRWRHDVVALFVLLLAVAGGLVEPGQAFLGFGHPAVITVAAVLILSRALESTGVIGALTRAVASDQPSTLRQVALFCAIGAVLSAFVNNVGALAMLMPVAIATARRHDISPSRLLMPLSFATMLGGMTTLIGTPPNIIVATFRADTGAERFGLFDFLPVGGAVALLGLAFLALLGWRLVPRDRAPVKAFEGVDAYVAELYVGEEAEPPGEPLGKLAERLEERDVEVLGVLRGDNWIPAFATYTRLARGDALLVEGAPEKLADLQGWEGLSLGKPPKDREAARPSNTVLAEVVLRPASHAIGWSAERLRLRSRYRVNLLGLSREGARRFGALRSAPFAAGDVLLLQGAEADVADAISRLDALPLGGERELAIRDRRASLLAVGAFVAALAAIGFGVASPAVALAAAVVVLLLTNVVRVRTLYDSLDGAVLVVLAALLPVGVSMQTTGLTTLIGDGLLQATFGASPYLALALVLAITMVLSDLINNAATAVVMAPIALRVAEGLGSSADPFLMAVAIGASCAFLTPIGHQNNLLVMGPGGYRFGDYWRVGLPLEVLIVIAATLLLPVVFPFAVAG